MSCTRIEVLFFQLLHCMMSAEISWLFRNNRPETVSLKQEVCQFVGFTPALYIVSHISNLEIFLKHLFNFSSLPMCVMEKELEGK